MTTGGTGPSPRDVTPEATEAVCEKLLDGFGELMRAVSLKVVPTAILSRQIAGISRQIADRQFARQADGDPRLSAGGVPGDSLLHRFDRRPVFDDQRDGGQGISAEELNLSSFIARPEGRGNETQCSDSHHAKGDQAADASCEKGDADNEHDGETSGSHWEASSSGLANFSTDLLLRPTHLPLRNIRRIRGGMNRNPWQRVQYAGLAFIHRARIDRTRARHYNSDQTLLGSTGDWCNGSTTDSGSVSHGSNP